MLVGRDREVSEVERALAQLAASRGSVLLFVGEPGIGKTRLASEAATLARDRGVRVSWGRCWEGGGAPAYWPWQEAFDGLGVPFPESRAIAASDPAEARFALFRDVAAALTRAAAAAAGPLLIILEDVHAADRSSLSLLELLGTTVLAAPIAIIATYRELEASLRPETADALARVGRTAAVLDLARLREADVAALVRDAVVDADERLVTRVYQTTLGNPLFVAEMVRQIRAGDAGTQAIPLGVREIIRQRIALISTDARRVLDVAAVLGVEFDASTVARITPGADAELESATRSGLVTARSRRVRFSHALYREALYHDLPLARRRALHRDAARALAGTGAPLAELAHHLLESGPDAAPEAIEQAIRAAAHASSMFAYDDAIALLERARQAVAPGPQEATLRCRVAIALGEARLRSGDPGGREACVEAARAARELGDATLLALAGLAYGSVFAIASVDPLLVGVLEEALERLPADESGLRARTMARLASARQPAPPRERDRDVELALQAVAIGRRVASRVELLEILQSASGALYGAADPRVRLPVSQQQEELALELGDTPRLLAARVRLANDYLEVADFTAYARNAAAYEELAGRIGRAAAPWRVPLMRSMLALLADRRDESERFQEESRRLEPDHPRARRAQGLHRICALRLGERHGELRAALPELRGLWMQLAYGAALVEPRLASTLARIGADDEVREVMAGLPASMYEEQINTVPLAQAIWATGDPAQAERLLPMLRDHAPRWMTYWLDVEITEGPVTRLLAYLSGILGDWAECDRLFAQALREVDAVAWRSVAARMRFELGDLMVRCGRDPARARALLAEARAGALALELHELVAMIDRRHATAGLAAATPPPSPPPPTGAPFFTITLEGEYYAIVTDARTLRFKATRGMQYIARLVEHAGTELHVLDLVGSADADRSDAGELLDDRARRAYRARLTELRDAAEDAEARGDVDRAERARDEMEAIARELGKASGPGGRPRRAESAVDRARSAVQRRIKDALDRVAEQDAALGARLRRAIRTGNHCSFRAEP